MTGAACPLCSPDVDEELGRTEVWLDPGDRLEAVIDRVREAMRS